MDPFDLGLYLKAKRKEKKLTQKQLGELVDLKPTTISGFESNTARPSIDSLAKIASVLSVDLNVLFGIKREDHQYMICDGLNERQIATLKAIADEYNRLNQNNTQ